MNCLKELNSFLPNESELRVHISTEILRFEEKLNTFYFITYMISYAYLKEEGKN